MNENDLYFASDFFIYEVDFSSIAGAASSTAPFTVQADSDFLLSKLAVMATDGADAAIQNIDSLTLAVMITDTGSGRNLSNIAAPISNFFGSGQLPFILPKQRIFVANATVNITITNFGADTYNSVRLSFIGEKKFRKGRA